MQEWNSDYFVIVLGEEWFLCNFTVLGEVTYYSNSVT